MSNFQETFDNFKQLNLSEAVINLWIVKRRLKSDKTARYTLLSVDTDPELKDKLKEILLSNIRAEKRVIEYDFEDTNDADEIAVVDLTDTDFQKILLNLNGTQADIAAKKDDLIGSWAYIIELKTKDTGIYAFKKTSESWRLEKKLGFNVLYSNQKLTYTEDKVFRIEEDIDFFSYKDKIYILNKKNFESGLNFRDGLEKSMDNLLKEFEDLNIFHDVILVKARGSNNLRLLRRFSTIKNNAYYKDSAYMEKLMKVNKKNNWGLQITDKKIRVTEDTLETILTLLCNSRLRSEINSELFDIPGRKTKLKGD